MLHNQQQAYNSVESHDIETLTEILPSNIKEPLLSIEEFPD